MIHTLLAYKEFPSYPASMFQLPVSLLSSIPSIVSALIIASTWVSLAHTRPPRN